MTTSQDLLGLTKAALTTAVTVDGTQVYATDAADRVYVPGDWPTQGDQYPILKVRLVSENKSSLGRAGINFTTVATIRVIAEVSAPAQLDNLGATAAEAQVWRLVRQVEVALINSYPLTALLQQFPSISTQLSFTSEAATHLAGAQIDVGMEFYQGAEDFAPIDAVDAADFVATLPPLPNLEVHASLT